MAVLIEAMAVLIEAMVMTVQAITIKAEVESTLAKIKVEQVELVKANFVLVQNFTVGVKAQKAIVMAVETMLEKLTAMVGRIKLQVLTTMAVETMLLELIVMAVETMLQELTAMMGRIKLQELIIISVEIMLQELATAIGLDYFTNLVNFMVSLQVEKQAGLIIKADLVQNSMSSVMCLAIHFLLMDQE